MSINSRVLGSGFVTGEHCVKNADLARICDTSDEWIRERTGIEQRYFVEEGVTTSDLGAQAALKAIEDAGLSKDDIDYIVVATQTPDYYFPGCGSLIQTKLGLTNIPALDIRQQCSGFIYGLQVSDALIRSGMAKKLLFIGTEVHTGFMPWSKKSLDIVLGRSKDTVSEQERTFNTQFRDRTSLFGDAAGAMVLTASEEKGSGMLGFALHSDGSKAQALYVPAAGFAYRPYIQESMLQEGRHVPVMDGKTVFKMAVTKMPEAVMEVCAKAGVKVQDIDLLIAHQANLRINEAVQRALELPDDRVYNNIQKYGNTTAATIPIAYDECRKSGRIKPGMLICFVGLGAGFHWGAALMRQ